MRKRSKYRPKARYANPIEFVMERISPVANHGTYLLDLKIKNHGAMTALVQGRATKLDMHHLTAMNNIVEALFMLGFGKQYESIMTAGYKAMLDASRRFMRDGRVTLYASEMSALNDLMELHDAQMEVITVQDMEKAIALVHKEVALGRAQRIIEADPA